MGDGALEQFARSEHLGIAWADLSEARAKQILGTAEARVASCPDLCWRSEWRMGNPAGEIGRFAREQSAISWWLVTSAEADWPAFCSAASPSNS